MRQPRRFLPGASVHVIQRGNNRMAIFGGTTDYEVFLRLLRHEAEHLDVGVHGFVLMTTHFHLIVTPSMAGTLPEMMKQLDGGYVRYFNQRYQRIGTLWNGRYRDILIKDERHWLTCLRYIEQNPVRAAMVSAPDAYRWSSYSAHAFGTGPDWLRPHRVYDELGSTPEERQAAYRSLCGSPLGEDELVLARGLGRVSDGCQTPV